MNLLIMYFLLAFFSLLPPIKFPTLSQDPVNYRCLNWRWYGHWCLLSLYTLSKVKNLCNFIFSSRSKSAWSLWRRGARRHTRRVVRQKRSDGA